jgi:hypothetical protein
LILKDGEINRAFIGSKVFGDKAKMKELTYDLL